MFLKLEAGYSVINSPVIISLQSLLSLACHTQYHCNPWSACLNMVSFQRSTLFASPCYKSSPVLGLSGTRK